MDNRWQMNRMGFVNFWLYDEETFPFADGKLLLRGQNGSGKSITTQSFIPFILDGDRAPSRLDPFGSSDRRMEYYFLGEGEQSEATGYLFLEFKRRHTNQYCTIGIGQKAQKGKPMGFWGFVILDGRRIGYDMNLYREAGSKKIPLSKQEMKNALGEKNIFTEKTTEYKSFVNKQIFGFPREEQYEQFIKLLIKVRAPKLSKEFKPTKVYEILNDSLQTLSDEDLRAMVEAMEKLDDIQSRLDSLKGTYKDLRILRQEYDRYNRYMVGKKAQYYLDEKKKVDGLRGKLEAGQAEIEEKKTSIRQKQEEIERINDEITVLTREKEALADARMEDAVDRLNEHQKNQQKKNEEKIRLIEKIESSRQKILEYDGRLREIQGNIDLRQSEINEYLEQLTDENAVIEFDRHAEVEKIINTPERERTLQSIVEALRILEKQVSQGETALRDLAEAEKQWDEAEKYLSELERKKESAKEQQTLAEKMEQKCRDSVIEQFYTKAVVNKELVFRKEDLDRLVSLFHVYDGSKDYGEIQNLLHDLWETANLELKSERNRMSSAIENKHGENQQLERDYQKLLEMKEPVPERRSQVEDARRLLADHNILFFPFYKTVEFAPELTQIEQDMLESQLADAGLLDALVVAEKDYTRAKQALQGQTDVLIWAKDKGGKPYGKLQAGNIPPELQETVKHILANIGEDAAGTTFVIGSNGYFKNGILEGYSKSEEAASYIGVQARKQKKERLLAEKLKELKIVKEELRNMQEQLSELDGRLQILMTEYQQCPGMQDLDQAIELVREATVEYKKWYEQWEQQEQVSTKLRVQVKKCEKEVLTVCKRLPYLRQLDVYQEVKESIPVYRDCLNGMIHLCAAMDADISNHRNIQELTEKEEEVREDNHYYLRQAENAERELEIQIQRIQEYLDDPAVQEKAERLKHIKKEMEDKQEQFRNNEKDSAVLKSDVERLLRETEEYKQETLGAVAKETRLRSYFEEELNLELVVKRESDTLDEAAVRAKACIREGDIHRSSAEIATALMERYQNHRGTLMSYGTTLEDWFKGDPLGEIEVLRARCQIASIWNGKKLYLEEFYHIVKKAIEDNELLIQERDRELFEGILADTLSRKLSSRISESRKWISDMSALMKDMDTSMGLTFSLEWRPISAEDEKELDTRELEKILRRDRELLTTEDVEKVSIHFRTKIHTARRLAEENEEVINYTDLVRDALDYRKWFEFRMYFYRNGENKKELTNGAFNRFSGGEKAMAMYVPLFAAVNAQYQKTENPDHPRMIALDEAFAGVDDKNISSMFELVQKLEFDYIMNSQVLWGCYETVKDLRIAELLRPANSDVVTAIYYYWNGREKMLDEQ